MAIEIIKTKKFIHKDNKENVIIISLYTEERATFNLMTSRDYDNGRGSIVNRVNETFLSSIYEVASKKFNATAENYVNKKGYIEQIEF